MKRWRTASLLACLGLACAVSLSVGRGAPDLVPLDSAFAYEQSQLNPWTVGLPVGATAPALAGVEYTGRSTLLVLAAREDHSLYWRLLPQWTALPGLQVVICWIDLPEEARGEAQAWPGSVIWVPDNVVAEAVTAFCVGETQGLVTFFIDGSGTIVGRRTRFSLRDAAALDGAVRSFAAEGFVEGTWLLEEVLWYETQAIYPEFPLQGVDGEEVWIRAGRPVMLLNSGCAATGQPQAIRNALAGLPLDYPAVDFVWFWPVIPWSDYLDMWEYARVMGLDDVVTRFGLPLEDYLAGEAPKWSREVEYMRDCMQHWAQGWIACSDPGYRLTFRWLLQAVPMVAILDAQGVVRLPPTALVVERTAEAPEGSVNPQAVAELREILDRVTAGGSGS